MDLNKETNFILKLLEEFLTPENSIKKFNSKTGEVLEYGESYEDLADYLPFIFYYNKKDLYELELKKTIDYLNKNDFIYVKKDKFPLGLFARSYAQSDLLFGLILAAKKDQKYLKFTEKFALIWYNTFFRKNPSMFVLRKGFFFNLPKIINFKFKVFSAEDHGMFIELFSLLFELTKKKKYLDISYEIFSKFKKDPVFQKYKFFNCYNSDSYIFKKSISNIHAFSKRDLEFQLLKQNSNTLFGVISLYYNLDGEIKSEVKSNIVEIVDSYIENFYDKDKKIFYTNFNFKNFKKGSDLTVFHFIEILIETYLITKKNEYKVVAENIVSNILKQQSKSTGLLPFLNLDSSHSIKRFNISKKNSWLDAEIDFLIATLRLYDLTKKEKYLSSMKKLLEGIVKYHKSAYGYVSEVDIHSGDVKIPIYSTKMLALILKAFIAFDNLGNLLDREKEIYYVLQDR